MTINRFLIQKGFFKNNQRITISRVMELVEEYDEINSCSKLCKVSMPETITLNRDTAVELELLINNLMSGKKPYYKKQKQALELFKNKLR